MYSTALALNWQIWGRHRWGLAGALVILASICALPQAYPPDKLTSNVGDTGMPFMMTILMPFGNLAVRRCSNCHLFQTGPARRVYRAAVDLTDLR